jgi:hypothetical protein
MSFKPLTDEELPEKLKPLIKPELQRFIDEPPGVGMAVIYVQVFPSKKMYVGQHIHGVTGLSYARTRSKKEPGTRIAYNAQQKYGIENMRSFIIAHCPEGQRLDKDGVYKVVPGDSNDCEVYFISSEGLDTLKPAGYNLKVGGQGGPQHEDTKRKMRETWSKPDKIAMLCIANKKSLSRSSVRKKIGDASKKQWQLESHKDKMAHVMAEVYKRPGMLDKRNSAIQKGHQKESTRSLKSNHLKLKWKNPSQRSSMVDSQKAFYATEAGKITASKRAKKAWQNPSNVAKREQNILVKDAKKWMPRFAACKTDDEVRLLIRQYERIVQTRTRTRNNRRARVAKKLNSVE